MPLAAVAALAGTHSVFTTQGLFFSGTAWSPSAAPTPHSPNVAQRAVEVYGWLTPCDMVRGLALAETTPSLHGMFRREEPP